MNWWQALILGLVEGITEYLPVSSTGHLVIAGSLMGLQDPSNPGLRDAVKSFEIVIQGGAILAVLGLYWPRVLQMIRGVMGQDAAGLRLLINIAIGFVPFALVAKLTHHWVKEHLMRAEPVIAAFIVGGVYMIVVDQWRKRRDAAHAEVSGLGTPEVGGADPRSMGGGIESLTPVRAAVIGVLQVVALIPGVSRSMMTITGGMFAGLRPAAAAEFSFLLGLPTLGAATVYSLYENYKQSHQPGADGAAHASMFEQLPKSSMAIGIVVAAVSAAIAVKWLVGFLNKHGMTMFGWYRIVAGLALLGLVLGKIVTISAE